MLQVGERLARNKGQRRFLTSQGRWLLGDGFTSRVQCEGPLRLVACGCIHENVPEEPARKGRTAPRRGRQMHSPVRGQRGRGVGGGESRTEGYLCRCRHGQQCFILAKGALPYSPGESKVYQIYVAEVAVPLQKRKFCPR